VRSLAQVGDAFRRSPSLEEALASGTLAWTKVRLLASVLRTENEAEWIARAKRLTAEQLSRRVRAIGLSIEPGALEDEDGCRPRVFDVRCGADVRWKWYAARGAASRAAGRMLRIAEAAELISAEVLSAIPVDEPSEPKGYDGVAAASNDADQDDSPASAVAGAGSWTPASPRGDAALEEVLVGLERADAFDLDERMRRVISMEQRLDARVGPLLARVWDRWAHRLLGYRTREAYARERLGMDATRARALVRLERAAAASEPFARGYRSGALSWVKAGLLAPLVSADPLGRFIERWIAWAQQVTVRRLREDVDWALALEETDPASFGQAGGLPSDDRETRATEKSRKEDGSPERVRETEEQGAETCFARFIGPPDVVQLFRAVVRTVRRRMEATEGRLPTEGEALGAMLDYVFSCWGVGVTYASGDRQISADAWT
jgi:hypothetical protein